MKKPCGRDPPGINNRPRRRILNREGNIEMEIILHGTKREVKQFTEEILFPVIRQKQEETEGKYFRITKDISDYWKTEKYQKVRKIRGYFPTHYYTPDPDESEAAGGDPPPEAHKAAQAAGISAQKTRRRARSYLQISGGSQDGKRNKQTRRRVKKTY